MSTVSQREYQDETCPKCHGKKKVGIFDRHECEVCNGTGRINMGSSSNETTGDDNQIRGGFGGGRNSGGSGGASGGNY